MLQQNLSQKLLQKLSPQQIQLMKLLQIPTAVLEQRIKEELEANPALEEGEEADEFADLSPITEDSFAETTYTAPSDAPAQEGAEPTATGEDSVDYGEYEEEQESFREDGFELDEYLNAYIEDDPVSYKEMSEGFGDDEEEKTVPIAVENSFQEYLENQLGLLDIEDDREMAVARQIIGSIDDDGYLRRDPSAIVNDLAFSQNIVTNEREVILLLRRIQRFDPPGVGARDLRECLLIQLALRMEYITTEGLDQPEKMEALENAFRIIDEYFEEFTKKHYHKLQRQLGVNEQELKIAVDEILKLNPKPSSAFNTGNNTRNVHYVLPDFIVENRDGELELSLNSRNAPDLRINEYYRDMLRNFKDTTKGRKSTRQEREAVMFIKQKIDSAKWFIDAIRQRHETMYKTMYAILRYQYDYFLTGDQKKLKPMILKDVADITGLDISTVSRVANSKFVQTEFGTKRLKDFFSESLQTSEGEEVSTLEVKKILTEIIGRENKKKPFSDEKLKSMLTSRGYNIARRTVAKYREQLNIPVARLRKEL